ncbi:MAG: hypothetical protein KTR32_06845 [Granulosicoccus sp.]|nr:hypothetical protein [Granulosicoccus sp.]
MLNLSNKTLNRLFAALHKHFINLGRSRARRALLGYDDRLLNDAGFSRFKLEQGVHAWPWRLEQDDDLDEIANTTPDRSANSNGEVFSRKQQKQAIAELSAYSDKELADLDISRDAIADTVRYGRSNIERQAGLGDRQDAA